MSEQVIRSNGCRQIRCSSRQSKRIVALIHEFYPDRGEIATYVQEVTRAVALDERQIEFWAPARANGDAYRDYLSRTGRFFPRF